MNDKWKKAIMYFVIALVLFCAGICTERCRCNRNVPKAGELTEQLELAKSELEQLKYKCEQQLRDMEQLMQQADGIKLGIDESIRITEQADESLRRAGLAIRNAGEAAGGGRNIIKQLTDLNKELTIAVGELQTQNIRLAEELRRIQSSIAQ